MILLEGGNVFKNEKGEPLTQRIDLADVKPTVKWLESLTGLNLVDNMLGSTGRKATSGDLDLGVDETKVSKQTLIDVLLRKGIKNTDIRKSGDSVHLKTPINGDPNNGYVQTDFMFTDDPKWQQFSLTGGFDSKFKGVHRHILLASIAKANGLKWSNKYGLISRTTNEVISKDPKEIARILINGSAEDMATVEGIINKIKALPNYEELVKDARESFERDNLVLPEMKERVLPGTGAWYKQWTYKL
jgi:hypothetical protein